MSLTLNQKLEIVKLSDSREVVKMLTLTGIWKKLIPTFMDDFKGIKTSVKEVNADVVGIP